MVSAQAILRVLVMLCFLGPAFVPGTTAAATVLEMEVGTGKLLRLAQPAGTVFVADTSIADVEVGSETSVFIIAKKVGRTNFLALAEDGSTLAEVLLRVSHNTSSIKDTIRFLFPDYDIDVKSSPGRLILTGAVATAGDAETIGDLIAGAIPEEDRIINRLSITGPTQVNLRVRVAEIGRTGSQRLGINWNALLNPGNFTIGFLTALTPAVAAGSVAGSPITTITDGGVLAGNFTSSDGRVNVTGIIDALRSEGLVEVLAEPNLTTVSGETASFLVGGEVPYPISEDNEVRIEFREVGISLRFTPTVLSADRISLKVNPEVSDLDESLGVTVNGSLLPGLSSRSVETTVELGSGQSFVIGGLLSQATRNTIQKIPGIGDLPVLGELFTSRSREREQRELIVIVTPYLVAPATNRRAATPIDDLRPLTEIERVIARRLTRIDTSAGPRALPNRVRLRGDAGFIY